MPKIAVFLKAFMQALGKDGTRTVSEWIKFGCGIDVLGFDSEGGRSN